MQIWALIVDSFRESLDRKIFWVMLLISLAVAGAMFCIGFEPHQISLLFGTWTIKTELFTVGDALRADLLASVLVEYIADVILGSIGILLALIATAGFFPALLERGGIEVLCSKPLPRWKLLLGKYIGSLVFIAVHATIFIFLTFLVAGIRWHVWIFRYFLLIPLMILMFSYLYCVSTLVAIYTRSTVAVILITIFAWFSFVGVQYMGDMFEVYPSLKEYRSGYKSIQTARWIVPKTFDITLIARKWTRAASPTDLLPIPEDSDHRQDYELAVETERRRMELSPILTIGSSLLFEAAILMIAMWKFSRKDF